jgi:phage terminase Nu1 subunit (DNA packaging protein)
VAKRKPKANKVEWDENGVPHGKVDSLRELAEALGLTHERVRQLAKEGMPRLTNGRWDAEAVHLWRVSRGRYLKLPAHVKTNQMAPSNGNGNTAIIHRKQTAEARVAEAKAEAAERANKLALANILERHDVDRFFSAVFSTFRDLVGRIPEELKPSFPLECREELTQLLRDRHKLVLTTIYNMRDEIEEIGQ